MIPRDDVSQLANGQWHHILLSLGLPEETLSRRGSWCPIEGTGQDRFTFDDLEGRGTYHCRGCGGAGDGFALLQKYHGWDFRRAADEVRRVLGFVSDHDTRAKGPLPNPPPKPSRKRESKSTSDYARKIWNSASPDEVGLHPYAVRKRIEHHAGARRGRVTGKLVGEDADCLIVPQRTLQGAVCGVECINAEGKKQSFGSKGLLILGNDLDPDLPMLVLEGYASTVKWLDSRRWNACAVVSFGKARQDAVAAELRSHYPRHTVHIAREVDG